jgi:hypothetical protein
MFEYFALKGKDVLKQRIKPFKQKDFLPYFFIFLVKLFFMANYYTPFFPPTIIMNNPMQPNSTSLRGNTNAAFMFYTRKAETFA